jgi:Matrixin
VRACRTCLAAFAVLLTIAAASPALAAVVSPRVLAAAQAFWAEYNQGQSPCSSVTVTYFDGPVLATDEPLHNGEAAIGYPVSSFEGAPVSQPCDLRFSRLLPVRSLAYQCAVAVHEIGHAGMGLEHTSDRTNVMFKYTVVPRFCRETFPQRTGPPAPSRRTSCPACGRRR